ncbi:hypothetical protein F5Y16DRAFT_404384 [Xylariaceae sp. FL0255]|nr:hypothetical protein F5Y16DRAFT_404384 [Xylariaceae sp. FL0255]
MAAVPAPGEDRPTSPWTSRFGLPFEDRRSDLYDEPNLIRSFLAPRQPSLHPKFYDNVPAPEEFAKPQNEEDCDKLFLSEIEQVAELKEIKSWEVASLNKAVNFGPRLGPITGGHDGPDSIPPSEVVQDFIAVDESRWFLFFRKDRWYNSALQNVDDLQLWNILRVGIELADRIVKALIKDQHPALQTALYGRLDYWRRWRRDYEHRDDVVLMSLDEERYQWGQEGLSGHCDGEWITQLNPEDWDARIETLLTGLKWFHSDKSESSASGFTQGWESCMIGVRVNLPSPPSFDDLTLAEIPLVFLDLAVTIVHELFHAIGSHHLARDRINGFPGFFLSQDDDRHKEPSVDFESDVELGRAFEFRIFGGMAEIYKRDELPIATWLASWPDEDGRYSRTTSWFASQMLSESFWQDAAIQRKSDNYFHREHIFESNEDGPNTVPSVGMKLSNTADQNTQEYQLLAPAFVNRQQIWHSRRAAWFPKAAEKWLETQWAFPKPRKYMSQLTRYFNEKDEYMGGLNSIKLVERMGWMDCDSFMSSLPREDHLCPDWIFFCVGLLFMAAAPIRTQNITRRRIALTGSFQIHPCAAALANGETQPCVLHYDNKEWKIGPSELYDHLGNRGRIENPRQSDYVVVVLQLLYHLTTYRCLVSLPWLQAVQQLAADVDDQRRALDPNYPLAPSNRWIERWTFKPPPYQGSSELASWNPDIQNWQRVRWIEGTTRWEFI